MSSVPLYNGIVFNPTDANPDADFHPPTARFLRASIAIKRRRPQVP